MIGTNAIYEYAAIVIGPNSSGANWFATNIDVGPSAAPIIPIEAACVMLKPNSTATIIVKNIPNWAAAPNRSINGFCRSGPKSIIAPIPIKISKGNNSVAIPISNKIFNTPIVSLPA